MGQKINKSYFYVSFNAAFCKQTVAGACKQSQLASTSLPQMCYVRSSWCKHRSVYVGSTGVFLLLWRNALKILLAKGKNKKHKQLHKCIDVSDTHMLSSEVRYYSGDPPFD